MEELIEKVENLKSTLDKNDKVKELQAKKEELEQDQELLNQINEYNQTQDERIKETILQNKKYREYKKIETDINLLILEINQELKKISDKGKC